MDEANKLKLPATLETRVVSLEKKCNDLMHKLNELDGKLMVVYEKLSQENFPLNLIE